MIKIVFSLEKVVVIHLGRFNDNTVYYHVSRCTGPALGMQIATFRLLAGTLHQAVRSPGYASPFVS